MAHGNSDHHEPRIIKLVKEKLKEGFSYTQVGKFLGMSRGQVAGIVDRHVENKDKVHMRTRKDPGPKLVPGSLGVVERQMADKSRITLINIPSIAQAQKATPYSYIARDQIAGKRTRDRRSVV